MKFVLPKQGDNFEDQQKVVQVFVVGFNVVGIGVGEVVVGFGVGPSVVGFDVGAHVVGLDLVGFDVGESVVGFDVGAHVEGKIQKRTLYISQTSWLVP